MGRLHQERQFGEWKVSVDPYTGYIEILGDFFSNYGHCCIVGNQQIAMDNDSGLRKDVVKWLYKHAECFRIRERRKQQ